MTSDAHSRMLHIEFSFIILIQYYFMLHTNVMQIYHIINRKKYTNSTLKIMIFFLILFLFFFFIVLVLCPHFFMFQVSIEALVRDRLYLPTRFFLHHILNNKKSYCCVLPSDASQELPFRLLRESISLKQQHQNVWSC